MYSTHPPPYSRVTVFFVNVYIVLLANSYRLDLLDAAAGADGHSAAGESRPKGESLLHALGRARGRAAAPRRRTAGPTLRTSTRAPHEPMIRPTHP